MTVCGSYSDALVLKASPYLVPCGVEYSMLSAAIFYMMYCNIGHDNAASDGQWRGRKVAFHVKTAKVGMIFGGLVFVMGLCCVGVLQSQRRDEQNVIIYQLSGIALFVLSGIVSITGYKLFKGFAFRQLGVGEINSKLLIFSYSGCVFYRLFMLIPSIHLLDTSSSAPLTIAHAILGFAGESIQTVFIMDVIRRRSDPTTPDKSPSSYRGRSLLTVLMSVNLTIWVIVLSEVRHIAKASEYDAYYGHEAWIILSYISTPMVSFYHNHAAVCLSDAWITAYE